MKLIDINTNFSLKTPPDWIEKKIDDPWENESSYPNIFFTDFNQIPEKISYIRLHGENFLCSDLSFMEDNKILSTFEGNKLKQFSIHIWDDYYFKLKETNKNFGLMYILYDDTSFQEDGNPSLIDFEVMLDTKTFHKIYNKINEKGDNINFSINVEFDKNNLFSELKKKENIESAKYKIIDFNFYDNR